MTDSDNNGWTSNSNLKIKIDTITIGTFSLSSGSTVSIPFPTIAPTSLDYPDSPFIITRDVSFTLTPTYVGDTVTFSISSGSLPTGLTLNPETGVISGTPVAYVIDRSVTIKLANAAGSITKQILFSVLINPTSCVADEILTTILYTTKANSAAENTPYVMYIEKVIKRLLFITLWLIIRDSARL